MTVESGLKCLDGRPAPPEVVRDVRIALALPPAAREHFWEILGHGLSEPLPRDMERQLDAFAQRHAVPGGELACAVKACRFLVREASLGGLSAADFADDLLIVAAGEPALCELVLPRYEEAKDQIRGEAMRDTVLDHGRLLEQVRWRIDTVGSSDRGGKLQFPVVTLTLHYREGNKRDQLTLQVLPDILSELLGICRRALTRR